MKIQDLFFNIWHRNKTLFYITLLSFLFFGTWAAAKERSVISRGELGSDEKSIINLFEKSKDTVVFISTTERVQDLWTRNVYSVPKGSGSGFIWDDQGHVVTNFHVIQNASEANVKLSDGRSYKAKLVGVSNRHDIAVLKINTGYRKPDPVPIGTSKDLKVGQSVFAIGNPFGLDWTLTRGIVSALDRSIEGENGGMIDHLIQTDAAINPGNSGGPLLDSASRLIGINTAIYSPSGSSAGIGFAIPVDTVNRVVSQLIQKGKYTRPGFGFEMDENINARLTSILKVEGVFVLRVPKGTEADKAGLKGITIKSNGDVTAGDIILMVNNVKVTSTDKLMSVLDERHVGESVKVGVLREGRRRDISINLQAE
jgi:S1-C subfamily serine protease